MHCNLESRLIGKKIANRPCHISYIARPIGLLVRVCLSFQLYIIQKASKDNLHTLALLLLIAGDVERNPGPGVNQGSCCN